MSDSAAPPLRQHADRVLAGMTPEEQAALRKRLGIGAEVPLTSEAIQPYAAKYAKRAVVNFLNAKLGVK